MKKILLFIAILSLTNFACQKENDSQKITYYIKGLSDSYKVIYVYDGVDLTKKEIITPKSMSDVWTFNFYRSPGQIAYIYLESKEGLANNMTFMTAIIVNGKVIQKAVNYDAQRIFGTDTVNVIKRSFTIPF